jgi:hypothetical protein
MDDRNGPKTSNLKPGATYIYEKANGVTYARESGAPASERIAIGWDYEYRLKVQLDEWNKILVAAKTNPALQEAVERVKIIYELSRDPDQEPPMWHPV